MAAIAVERSDPLRGMWLRFGHHEDVADQPPPKDETLLAVLQERDGLPTAVVLSSGSILRCFNIAWGYDMGDEYAHVTTNCSPLIDALPLDFFVTSDVVRLEDQTGRCLFESARTRPERGMCVAFVEADTCYVKHESPDGGHWRPGRALLDSLNKGTGAARRSRAAALSAGNFLAFMRLGMKWAEGRATVVEGRLTFVSSGGEVITLNVASHGTRSGVRWRVARTGGIRVVRVRVIELIAADQTQLIAVGKNELPVLLATIA